MGEVIERHPEVIEAAEEAIRRLGVEPVESIIRGGTDGARLSQRGLPTPNLFTGGSEYHSRREWASVHDMAAAAAMIVELARISADPRLGRFGEISAEPPGRAARPEAASSVAPIETTIGAPCVLASERPAHPGNERHSAKPS